MGAVAEGSPLIRAQANLSALGLHEMAASLPDYVRMVAAGERGFASALEEMTRVEVAAREVRITNQRIRSLGMPQAKANAATAAELVRWLWALGMMCREAGE